MEPARLLIAILLPPLATFLERGASAQFVLNLILTGLFYIPGLIHVMVLLFLFRKAEA